MCLGKLGLRVRLFRLGARQCSLGRIMRRLVGSESLLCCRHSFLAGCDGRGGCLVVGQSVGSCPNRSQPRILGRLQRQRRIVDQGLRDGLLLHP